MIACRATASSGAEPKAAIRLIPASDLDRSLGERGRSRACAHDPEGVVDEDQQVPAAARQEGLEGGGGGRVVHAGLGVNA